MSNIKIIAFLILGFIVYKIFVAVKNFEIGVSKQVAEIEKIGFEREDEVIGLMMYLGDEEGLRAAYQHAVRGGGRVRAEQLELLDGAHEAELGVRRLVARRRACVQVGALPVEDLLVCVDVDAVHVIAELLQPPQVMDVATPRVALIHVAALPCPLALAALHARMEAPKLDEHRVDHRLLAGDEVGRCMQ